MKIKKERENKWHKLDNTAKIYPVIANSHFSGVYRMSVTLKEKICPEKLQKAVEIVTPWFETFHVRLRRGVFWYYYETNKKLPEIEKEFTYPCRYIDPYSNNQYLFRVSYYECRINLEVFHGLTDGNGALLFLKELLYQYLRLAHREELSKFSDAPENGVSFHTEDSYQNYYKKRKAKSYHKETAYQLEGIFLEEGKEGILHGYIDLEALKRVCKNYQVSITQYFLAVLVESIYVEKLHSQPSRLPIRINVPVNLRAFFESTTIRNFFAAVIIGIPVKKENETFEEILSYIKTKWNQELTKENLEKLISYNVRNEKHWYLRILPLFIKNIGIKLIYSHSTKTFTTTISNLGMIQLIPEYQPYVERFHFIMGVSKKQPMKCIVCSYKKELVFTFSSVLKDTSVQRHFFRKLSQHGIPVKIESNGVYQEENKTSVTDPPLYPKIEFDMHHYHILIRLFFFLSVVTGGVLLVVNLSHYHGFFWSGIVIAAILYAIMTVVYSIQRNTNPAAKIMVQTLAAELFVIWIDYLIGYEGWSVNYAVPGILMVAESAMLVLQIVNFMNWQSYILFQIEYIILSIIPVGLWFAHIVTRPIMTFLTLGFSVLIFVLTMIFGDKKAKEELIRRFHI